MIRKLPLLLKFCLTLLVIFFASELFAQEAEYIDDPKKKPAIWAKLKENPTSSETWYEYMGKKWTEMSLPEQEQVSIMRQELLLRKLTEGDEHKSETGEAVASTSGTTVPKKLDSTKATEMANIEALFLAEESEITDLKTNISENFVILEDKYRELFAEYGQTYKPYDEAHPDGKRVLSDWIDEQEKKLKELKRKQLDEFKKKNGLK